MAVGIKARRHNTWGNEISSSGASKTYQHISSRNRDSDHHVGEVTIAMPWDRNRIRAIHIQIGRLVNCSMR